MNEAYQNHELSEPAPGQNERKSWRLRPDLESTSLTKTSKPLIKKIDSNSNLITGFQSFPVLFD